MALFNCVLGGLLEAMLSKAGRPLRHLGLIGLMFMGLSMAAAGGAWAQVPAVAVPEGDTEAARVRRLIQAFEAGAPEAKAVDIMRFRGPQGRLYLIMSPCCDQFNYLYTAEGVRVCAPSGGLTGRGDGRCPPEIEPVGLPSDRPGSGVPSRTEK